MKDEEARSLFMWIAIGWADLADLAERNGAAGTGRVVLFGVEYRLDEGRGDARYPTFDEEKGMVLIADRPGDPVRIHWLDDADLVRIIKFVTIGAVN
jgi:hypothetical protein